MRATSRTASGLRPLSFEPDFIKYPDGSCLVRMGNTWVICSATVENKVPPWLEHKEQGWLTAEYSMLPCATNTRTRRESTVGRPAGRSQEIQRIIGRALRSCLDLKALGERTILIDCDVLQADGGTRTASINGAFVALASAVQSLQRKGTIASSPVRSAVAAVSVGLKGSEILVDLDYDEDSTCDVDMNIVMLEEGKIVEMQGTAERGSFSSGESQRMVQHASEAISEIMKAQKEILKKAAHG
ncbi:MAG: ribonuclease PH [Pseudomonadota bacterium]